MLFRSNAFILVEVDDAIGILNDCSGTRAGLEAAWVFAMHTAVLTDQPFEVVIGSFMLRVTHHRPRIGSQVAGVVVHPNVATNLVTQIIPFRTRHLAGLAADAQCGIDEFCHLVEFTY